MTTRVSVDSPIDWFSATGTSRRDSLRELSGRVQQN